VAIRDYLVRLGVPAARLGVVSFGEERPAVAGVDDDARARNRRGELVLGAR
jgi:peptidoglycan-associated lipoprotein